MASSFAGNPVFIERSHFFIDSVATKLCNQADPVPGTGTTPTAAGPKNNGHQ
jgi:hypothetical protein